MRRPRRVAKSGLVESMSTPRWVLAIPLTVSFGLLLPQLFGWGEGAAWDALSWSVLLFPHALAFPLTMLPIGPLGVAAVLGVVDAGLCALYWSTQPPRLSLWRLLALIGLWMLLSAFTAFAAPYLMGWASAAGGS